MNILPHVGPFEIERQIARGALGAVYMARDCRNDQPVAVKTLLPTHRGIKSLADTIRLEGLFLSRIRSEHVVEFRDSFESDLCGPMLAMQPITGTTLRRKIVYTGLTVDAVIRIGIQLCTALRVLHNEAQLVHRDIKPGNIMITPEGRAVLIDFGAAASIESSRMRRSRSRLVGTPDYLAPEQYRPDQEEKLTPLDLRRADIYALGMTLYETLCRRLPFMSGEAHDVLQVRQLLDPSPPSSFEKGISQKLDAVILRAIARSPDKRWQSCDDMHAALTSAL